MSKNCPQCKALIDSSNCLYCGWKAQAVQKIEAEGRIFPCFFKDDGKCKFHNKAGSASIRINDTWLCNWHYQNGFDRMVRHGEKMPAHELKIQQRLFGKTHDIKNKESEQC